MSDNDFISELGSLVEHQTPEAAENDTPASRGTHAETEALAELAPTKILTREELDTWARDLAFKMKRHDLPVRQIAGLIGKSHSTVHRWIKQAGVRASASPQQLPYTVQHLQRDAARLRTHLGEAAAHGDGGYSTPRQRMGQLSAEIADLRQRLEESEAVQEKQQNQIRALKAATDAIRKHLGV